MDIFGIGTMLKGCLNVSFITSRQTGRTNKLASLLKSGDRVIVSTSREGHRIARLAAQRGVNIIFKVIPLGQLELVYRLPLIEAKTYFDHSWLEHFYDLKLSQAIEQINELEKRFSNTEKSSSPYIDHRWIPWQ